MPKRLRKSPAVVGSGTRSRPDGLQEAHVLAQPLDVLDAGAAREQVVGLVQDVIGLVVREVTLEHIDAPIQCLGQAEGAHELVDQADAAQRRGLDAARDLVVEVPALPPPGPRSPTDAPRPDGRRFVPCALSVAAYRRPSLETLPVITYFGCCKPLNT